MIAFLMLCLAFTGAVALLEVALLAIVWKVYIEVKGGKRWQRKSS